MINENRTPVAQSNAKPTSFRLAINAMCYQCIYDPAGGAGGSWRQQVEACVATHCALWKLRPKSSGVEDEAEKAEKAEMPDEADMNLKVDLECPF